MEKPAKYFLRVNDEIALESDNDAFGRVIDRIRAVAKMDVNVLIVGGPWSGKEVVAEAVHAQSGRNGAYVRVNCAALSPTLLESELFGHSRGAFTDARTDRRGLFNQANGGTIFMDEMCQMDAGLQSKLLRVVEYGEYYRLGSDRAEKTTARIVTAVNIDLHDAIKHGRLRKDLYYRLAEYIIQVPDLRERSEDVGRLIQFFFRKICAPKGISAIDEDCFAKLKSYDWPGNVRELQNVMNAAAINCRQRGGNTLVAGDLDVFPSQLAKAGAADDSLCSVDAIAGRVCEGETSFGEGMETFRYKLLQTVRDRMGGDAARIAKAMGKSESAVRMLYSRHSVSLGKTRDNHTKSRNAK